MMSGQPLIPSRAVSELWTLYEELEDSARQYAGRENVNEKILAAKNRQLFRFHQSISSFQSMRYLTVWERIDSQLIDLQQVDLNVDSLLVQILLSEKPKSCPAHLTFDLSRV